MHPQDLTSSLDCTYQQLQLVEFQWEASDVQQLECGKSVYTCELLWLSDPCHTIIRR